MQIFSTFFFYFHIEVNTLKAWFTPYARAHAQLKVARVFTPAAHAQADPSIAFARLSTFC